MCLLVVGVQSLGLAIQLALATNRVCGHDGHMQAAGVSVMPKFLQVANTVLATMDLAYICIESAPEQKLADMCETHFVLVLVVAA